MRRLLVAVAVALAVAGCGSEPAPDAGPTSPSRPGRTVSADAAELQLRVVDLARGIAAPSGRPAPAARWAGRYAAFVCSAGVAAGPDAPGDYLLACGGSQDKYLLEPAAWSGIVEGVDAVRPEQQTAWAVNVTLPAAGASALEKLSRELVESGGQVAIVIDGKVVSAAGFGAVITDGELQITPFDEAGANALADELTGS